MSVNAGYTRRTELRCTLAELATYGAVIPFDGEAVYIKQTDGRYAVKMGDGATPLSDLPYSVNYSEMATLKTAVETAKTAAESAKEAAETAKAGAEAAVESLSIGITCVDGALCVTYEEE